MAFLDNSGDIILDAVLTDTGRKRLARGDGTFKIVKFALGDDEINYETYDPTDSRGSSYFDQQILLSPVLEAFTNNRSMMKSKLVSYSRTDHLHLPVILWYDESTLGTFPNKIIHVLVDLDTEKLFTNSTSPNLNLKPATKGLILGSSLGLGAGIVLEQGLNTTEISHMTSLSPELKETQYLIDMDNRFASLISSDMQISAGLSFLDDDNIATYNVNLNTDPSFVEDLASYTPRSSLTVGGPPPSGPIKGPFGTSLNFSLKTGLDLQSSTYLFTTLGSTTTPLALGLHASDTTACYVISTTIRVSGVTTGSSMDLPVKFIKKQ